MYPLVMEIYNAASEDLLPGNMFLVFFVNQYLFRKTVLTKNIASSSNIFYMLYNSYFVPSFLNF